jgi:hypothetical protein
MIANLNLKDYWLDLESSRKFRKILHIVGSSVYSILKQTVKILGGWDGYGM